MTENDKQQVENTSVFEGFDTDDEGDDDIHFCKRCKLMFTSLEEYLKHKVKHDNYKVTYSRSGDRRTIVPKLVQRPDKTVRDDGEDKNQTEEKENRKQKQRGRKKLTEEINTELLVVNKQTYWCPKCNLRFNREATLRRHVEYVHDNSGDYTHVGDEDYEEDGGAGSKKHFGEIGTPQQISSSEDTSNQVAAQQHTEAEDKADRPYVCSVCSNRFKEINVLNAHMLTHTNKRDFRCNFPNCNYSFKTKGSLKRHLRRHTGERPFSCEECGRRFTESGALTRHLKSRVPCKNKSDNDLPRYGKRWGFGSGIDNNMRMTATCVKSEITSQNDLVNECEETSQPCQQEQDGETECAVAEVIASSEVSNIEEAVAIAVKENLIESEETLSPTQCKVCKEDFLSQDELRIHLRTHLADVPFKCGLCHFIAETRNQISSHMISQHQSQLKGSELMIQIPVALENESGVKKDENREARIAVKQLLELPGVSEVTEPAIHKSRAIFKCPVCLKAFRNNHYLRQHMRAHTGERPHKCPHCEKSFITKDTLSKHLSVHSDMRNYKCGQCGKLFKRISHVREHLKIHSFERPFPCSVCEKSFKTNNAMKVHLRTHTRILPYVCPFCRRRFREKGSLQRHQRIHTGERPYRCKHCGRSFAEHGTLNRHLKAKMPCTQQLHEERQEEEQQQLKDSEEMTVLAEFSSVVADTQQYMMSQEEEQDTDQIQENMEATEYVVVQTGLNLEDLKNVEIITEEEVDSTFLEGVQVTDDYVVVTETGENMKIVDSRTGETLATMPLSSITDENQIVTLESTSNQIEAVAMAPTAEGETELVNVLSTSSDIHIASDVETPSSDGHTVDTHTDTHTGIVAMAPLTDNQIEAIAMAPTTGEHMEVNITTPVENAVTETVEIVPSVDIGDSIKQAMVAAEVVEEQVETTSNELF